MAGFAGLEGLLSFLLLKRQKVWQTLALFSFFRFHFQNSENEANLLALIRWLSVALIVVAKHQTRARVCQLETSFSPGCI